MKLTKTTLIGFLVLLILTLSSCGTARRAGKDLAIGIGSVAVVLYGASTDAYSSAKETRAGYGGGSWTEVASMPFYFIYHGVKHTFFWAVHVVDLFFTPFYGIAELHPYGPEIEPLDYYSGTWFDKTEKGPGALDFESGETKQN